MAKATAKCTVCGKRAGYILVRPVFWAELGKPVTEPRCEAHKDEE